MAALLSQISADGLTNVKIFPDDARLLIARLAPASLSRIILLFPDPWPKKRHHKRRFVSSQMVMSFAKLLVDAGEFRFATDHAALARWTLWHMQAEPRMHWLAEGPNDWREQPKDWLETRYEQKTRAMGKRPIFLRYERLPRNGAKDIPLKVS